MAWTPLLSYPDDQAARELRQFAWACLPFAVAGLFSPILAAPALAFAARAAILSFHAANRHHLGYRLLAFAALAASLAELAFRFWPR